MIIDKSREEQRAGQRAMFAHLKESDLLDMVGSIRNEIVERVMTGKFQCPSGREADFMLVAGWLEDIPQK